MKGLLKYLSVALLITSGLFCVLYINASPSLVNRLIKESELSLISSVIDTNEFAPGHPSPTMSAREQITFAPDPRYMLKHDLLPNVLWISPRYLGGAGQDAPTKKIIDESCAIMLQLSQRMNYALVLPGNTYGTAGYSDPKTIAGAYIKLANDHPELPAAVITFWGQATPRGCNDPKGKGLSVARQDFPNSYYIPVNGKKRIGPAAPADSFERDGRILSCYLKNLCDNLKRPVDLINENGEVFKLFGEGYLKNDSSTIADKKRSGITDWDIYEATRRLEKEKAFQKGFLHLPCFKNAIYTEYGIDGHKTYRHEYSVIRKVNSQIKGQYYSTPDFYPRWPSNWKTWKGAWHGFKWIADSRTREIALGDELYSPFVSAGWDYDEEKNIRPAQWLALLKALGVTGAEFYYPGFFSLKKPFPKPENYAWQALIPGYAQAITSRYEHYLRNSTLLGLPFVNLSKVADELIVARKVKDKNIYIISGSIQATSNAAGATESERITEVVIDRHKIRFKIRRQGSTYIYDLTGKSPVFYQLDEWHEYKHPVRWKQASLMYEAELNEDPIKTKVITERSTANENDFSEFRSYVEMNGVLTYSTLHNGNLKYAHILCKQKDTKGELSVNGEKINAAFTNDWAIQTVELKSNATLIELKGNNLFIDKIYLSSSQTLKQQ